MANIYSTDEQVYGVWIDGKVIYKKTIYLGSLPNNSTAHIAHNIQNLGEVVRFEGVALRSSDNVAFQLSNTPNPKVSSPLPTSINIVIEPTTIGIATGNDRSNMTGYVTIYYTKI